MKLYACVWVCVWVLIYRLKFKAYGLLIAMIKNVNMIHKIVISKLCKIKWNGSYFDALLDEWDVSKRNEF